MKTKKNYSVCGSIAAALLALAASNGSLYAQENIVALGKVAANGDLLNGEATAGGVIVPVRNAAGDYTISVAAAGAFASGEIDDFAVQATIASNLPGEQTIKTSVTAVTDDVVTFTLLVDDVEYLLDGDIPLPIDSPFFFTLFRIPATFPLATTPEYLLGSGVVLDNGALAAGTGAGGVLVASSLNAAGDYDITLSKPGGFSGDVAEDYVLNLTIKGTGTNDTIVRGDVADVSSNDSVIFNIRTDDVQAAVATDVGVAASNDFYFTAYRIPGTLQPNAGPNLVVAVAGVNADGTLHTAANSFDGGTLSSGWTSTGNYRVIIVSPSAFSGKSANEFGVHATLGESIPPAPLADGIVANAFLADDSTLIIDISVNDLHVTGEPDGVAIDAPFSLLVLSSSAAADRTVQPDLRIGDSRNLTSMEGDDIYNITGAGQDVHLSLTKNKWSKYYFALENDGSRADTVRLNGTRKSRKLNTKYFRVDGRRKNITSQVVKMGSIEGPLLPGEIIRYEGWVKYLSPRKRPRLEVPVSAQSLIDATKGDTVQARVKSERWKRGRGGMTRSHGRGQGRNQDRER